MKPLLLEEMSGRQIIVYDKRREAIQKQKPHCFKAWQVDRDEPTLEVWRVEIRTGKKELKDKYQIRTLHDVPNAIGDVLHRALQDIRYVLLQAPATIWPAPLV